MFVTTASPVTKPVTVVGFCWNHGEMLAASVCGDDPVDTQAGHHQKPPEDQHPWAEAITEEQELGSSTWA